MRLDEERFFKAYAEHPTEFKRAYSEFQRSASLRVGKWFMLWSAAQEALYQYNSSPTEIIYIANAARGAFQKVLRADPETDITILGNGLALIDNATGKRTTFNETVEAIIGKAAAPKRVLGALETFNEMLHHLTQLGKIPSPVQKLPTVKSKTPPSPTVRRSTRGGTSSEFDAALAEVRSRVDINKTTLRELVAAYKSDADERRRKILGTRILQTRTMLKRLEDTAQMMVKSVKK